MERLKGIPLKLNAIDGFISENSNWLGKVVFLIIGISAQERGSDYHQTVRDVKILVDQINSKYNESNGGPLIYFEEKLEKDMKIAQRLAFLGASDIFMSLAARYVHILSYKRIVIIYNNDYFDTS